VTVDLEPCWVIEGSRLQFPVQSPESTWTEQHIARAFSRDCGSRAAQQRRYRVSATKLKSGEATLSSDGKLQVEVKGRMPFVQRSAHG
jgi:hypothetical protein